ncbi:MAG: MFS transporter, partial [SAR202 cluster bacterium]|nr:MFS transporter [SAR202 cluster bacterium]
GVSAILVIPALVLYSSLKPIHHTSVNDASGSITDNIKAGLSYVFEHSTLRFLMLGAIVMILTVGPFQSLMPVFAEEVLNVGAGGLGVLMLAAGVGSLAGSLTVVAIGEKVSHQKLELAFGLLASVTLIGFALSSWYLLSISLVTITAFAATSYMVVNMTVVQVYCPDYIRGRVVSIRFLVIGLMPFGALSMGAAAEALNAPIAVALIAVIGAVGFAAVQLVSRIFTKAESPKVPNNQ